MRWAVLGTGAVAAKFALGLRSVPGAEVALVAGRDAARAQALARHVGAEASSASYAEAAEAAGVDAAYIATPPALHRPHAIACLEAGKAVLIEKPFAASAADAQAIAEAAQRAGVFCMEAMWTRFMPAVAAAREVLARGDLGSPRLLVGSFAAPQRVEPGDSAFDPALGGGALRHRGLYPISLAFHLLGPARLAGAWRQMGASGVDESVSALLAHDGGAASQVYASLRTSADNGLSLECEGGRLRFLGPIYRPHGIAIERVSARGREQIRFGALGRLREAGAVHRAKQWLETFGPARRGPGRARAAAYDGNGYGHEAAAVAACLADGRREHPLMPLAESVSIAALMDEILAADAGAPPRT